MAARLFSANPELTNQDVPSAMDQELSARESWAEPGELSLGGVKHLRFAEWNQRCPRPRPTHHGGWRRHGPPASPLATRGPDSAAWEPRAPAARALPDQRREAEAPGALRRPSAARARPAAAE